MEGHNENVLEHPAITMMSFVEIGPSSSVSVVATGAIDGVVEGS